MKKLAYLLLAFILIPIPSYAEDDYENDNDDTYRNVYNLNNQDENESDFFTVKKEKKDLSDFNFPNCDEEPLQISKCQVAICSSNSPFGLIYRKISPGEDGASCKYSERTPGYGGINCVIKPEEKDAFFGLMQRRFDGYVDQNLKLTDDESLELTKQLKNKCTVIKDATKTSVVAVDSAKLESTDPEFDLATLEKTEKGNEIPIDDSAKNKKKPRINAKKIQFSGDNIVTIAYTEREYEAILDVLEGFSKADSRSSSVAIKRRQNPRTFYLSSILYYGAEKWTIWLNNQRYDEGNLSNGDLKVNQVSPNEVKVTWKAKNIDKLSPQWKLKTQKVKDNQYETTNKTIRIDLLDEVSSDVSFALKPNQTFEATTLTILEGKIGK